MKKEMDKTILTVERILKANKGARDSDRALILEFMFGHTSLAKMSDKMQMQIVKAIYTEMPAFETITRCRRKLQGDGFYKGSMATKQLRNAKAKAMKAMFR